MFRKSLFTLGILMLMGTALTPKVEGSLILRLTNQSGVVVTVADGSALDLTGAVGAVTYSGAVGSNWIVNVSTGISQPVIPSSSGYAGMDLSSVNVSNSAGWLMIEITDTNFPAFPQNGILTGNFSGTTGGNVTGAGYINDSNIGFDTLSPEADVQYGPGTGAFAGSVFDTHGSILNPYSMTLIATINHGNGVNTTSINFELINAVPVPAGFVMFVIGGGIMGAAEWLRRRRHIAVA